MVTPHPARACLPPTQANKDWVKTLTDRLDEEKGRLSATGVYAVLTATSGTVNIWWRGLGLGLGLGLGVGSGLGSVCRSTVLVYIMPAR